MNNSKIDKVLQLNDTFQNSRLFTIKGKCGSLILENDGICTDNAINFVNFLKLNTKKTDKHFEFLFCDKKLNHEQIKEIKELIENKLVKNIVIDSLFKDIKQFRFLLEHMFFGMPKLNFFIFSVDKLLETINDQFKNNLEYYKYSPDRNFLSWIIEWHSVYEIDTISNNDYTAKLIKYNYLTGDFEYTKQFKM